MIAAASGSPALEALVCGHLAAGRPGMAALALRLSPEALAALDRAFAEAKDRAAAAGALTAALAVLNASIDRVDERIAEQTERLGQEDHARD